MYTDYIHQIEQRCDRYEPSLKTKSIYLTYSETKMILSIGRGRLRNLIRQDFLQIGPNAYQNYSFKSVDIEIILISNRHQRDIDYEQTSFSKEYLKQVTLNDIAALLNTNYETARKLAKTQWLIDDDDLELSPPKSTNPCPSKLRDFYCHYILASSLAKELDINPTNLVEKLKSIGIKPISGPHIDNLPINIYTRQSVLNIRKSDVVDIENYKTRTGRHKKGTDITHERNEFISLKGAANILSISPYRVAVLCRLGILSINNMHQTPIKIHQVSVLKLKQKLENPEYLTTTEASKLLNCTLNWLNRYWCKSEFLEIEDLHYWKLVKRNELDEILKLKEEYLTGAEASKLLGMRHSYISNLQKQGVIQAYYLGKTDFKVRLFKKKDVSCLERRRP